MINKLRKFSFLGSGDIDRDLTFSKFMIEAASICVSRYWRAQVSDNFDDTMTYGYDFGVGDMISDNDMRAAKKEDYLTCYYYEVFLDEDGIPDVRRKMFEVVFVAKEKSGERNEAVENSLYRTFAAYLKKAIETYNTRLIFGDAYVGERELDLHF